MKEDSPYWSPKKDSLELAPTITSINDVRYKKYSKLKIVSVCRIAEIFHCETECGKYLWVEAHSGSVVMCLAERSYDIGENAEPVSRYTYVNRDRPKPTFEEIKQHMRWEINEEDAWVN